MINERHLSEGTFRFYVAGSSFLLNDAEAGMAGGEDQASPEQEAASGCPGPYGGGFPVFGHQQPQAQGDADDHVFIGIEGQ